MDRCVKGRALEDLKVGNQFHKFWSSNGDILGPLLEVVSITKDDEGWTELEYKWADKESVATRLPSMLTVCVETKKI